MNLKFWKYQGTGNDFIIVDNRELIFDKSNIELVQQLCDRKFGIGADGFILIENHEEYDFNMIFYNPDGSQSFCGNGSRAAVQFAHQMNICRNETHFLSTDGPHEAKVSKDVISLKMSDITNVNSVENDAFMDTGSPHHIVFSSNINELDIVSLGKSIRYSNEYKAINGTNVNFIENSENGIGIRTYERGVENETLSCGTGVTAGALAAHLKWNKKSPIEVESKGGKLKVEFEKVTNGFQSIWLIGPAEYVFKGEINV